MVYFCLMSQSFVLRPARVSGGHLCEAEAPTEPAGETGPILCPERQSMQSALFRWSEDARGAFSA